MKTIIGSAVLLIAAMTASSWAHSFSLEVHETGTGDGTYTKWITDWGSYDRDFRRQKRILITVHDLSRKASSAIVRIYFIAHPMGRERPLFVYGYVSQEIDFRGRIEVRGEINAPPLDANVQNYAALGVAYTSGADIDGWIAIGEFNGRPFQICASRQALFDLAAPTGSTRSHDSRLRKTQSAEMKRHSILLVFACPIFRHALDAPGISFG